MAVVAAASGVSVDGASAAVEVCVVLSTAPVSVLSTTGTSAAVSASFEGTGGAVESVTGSLAGLADLLAFRNRP